MAQRQRPPGAADLWAPTRQGRERKGGGGCVGPGLARRGHVPAPGAPARRGWASPRLPRSGRPSPCRGPGFLASPQRHCGPAAGAWHCVRREREAGPRRRQQMGTIWAGSCRSGRAWQPLLRPGTVPARASGFSGCQRGRGGPAGRRALSSGFPLRPGSSDSHRQGRSWPCHSLRRAQRGCPRAFAPAAPAPSTPAGSLTSYRSRVRSDLSWEALPRQSGLAAASLPCSALAQCHLLFLLPIQVAGFSPSCPAPSRAP